MSALGATGIILILYLMISICAAVPLGWGVAKDIRSERLFASLTRGKFLIAYTFFVLCALWYGLKWPYFAWLEHQRNRDIAGYIHVVSRQMKELDRRSRRPRMSW